MVHILARCAGYQSFFFSKSWLIYEQIIFQVPKGEVLTFGDENFINFEEAGIREARKAAFVLVAGGLGERLGYNGIKVTILHNLFIQFFSAYVCI